MQDKFLVNQPIVAFIELIVSVVIMCSGVAALVFIIMNGIVSPLTIGLCGIMGIVWLALVAHVGSFILNDKITYYACDLPYYDEMFSCPHLRVTNGTRMPANFSDFMFAR